MFCKTWRNNSICCMYENMYNYFKRFGQNDINTLLNSHVYIASAWICSCLLVHMILAKYSKITWQVLNQKAFQQKYIAIYLGRVADFICSVFKKFVNVSIHLDNKLKSIIILSSELLFIILLKLTYIQNNQIV